MPVNKSPILANLQAAILQKLTKTKLFINVFQEF